jgi:hypothetical protein
MPGLTPTGGLGLIEVGQLLGVRNAFHDLLGRYGHGRRHRISPCFHECFYQSFRQVSCEKSIS